MEMMEVDGGEVLMMEGGIGEEREKDMERFKGGHDFPAAVHQSMNGFDRFLFFYILSSINYITTHLLSFTLLVSFTLQFGIFNFYTNFTTSSFSIPNNLPISAMISTISFDNCPVTRTNIS